MGLPASGYLTYLVSATSIKIYTVQRHCQIWGITFTKIWAKELGNKEDENSS